MDSGLEDEDEVEVDDDFASIYHRVKRVRRVMAGAIEAGDLPAKDVEANPPSSNPYPLSRQVFNLEKREQEAQDKCKFLEKEYQELAVTVERLTTARDEERSDNEARCKSLEAANAASLEQLKEEKDKLEDLCIKNESLAADLAAASEEKTFLTEMLEEKTHESYVFRCALAVVFKLTPSIRERITFRDLLRDVLLHYYNKRQKERQNQENQNQHQESQGQEQNDTTMDSEPPPQQEQQQDSSPWTSDAAESDVGSKDLRLRRKRPWAARAKRSSGDTDDDMPLIDVLKKRPKKSKTMSSSHGETSSVA
ncbi:hypothetical protein Trco_005070 [Trichoderma cornu-damae]|uniref:Uncharacterized protein n=1 Tax=Trichoderma cornu-damae TaxID=654480 RepID=A0A9P8TVD5_9HYPO|nr:hypothetical protein Trco_005070 [Trichoderma cornu-damae]